MAGHRWAYRLVQMVPLPVVLPQVPAKWDQSLFQVLATPHHPAHPLQVAEQPVWLVL